jgi:phosphosulfolactate synthase (CoM biosynthesis protein A)
LRIARPLTLLRAYWKVDLDPSLQRGAFDGHGTLVDTLQGVVQVEVGPEQEEGCVYVEVAKGVVVKVAKCCALGKEAALADLALEHGVDDETEESIAHLSTGALKSLVQKLVRFGPKRVSIPARDWSQDDTIVSSEKVLVAAVLALAVKPLSFVPDLQVYVFVCVRACVYVCVCVHTCVWD